MKKYIFCLSIIFLSQLTLGAPKEIQFQGRLTDRKGIPIVGTPRIRLEIYPSLTGGPALYTQVIDVQTNEAGLFSTTLGPLNDPSLLITNNELYIEVAVRSVSQWQPLQPRKPLLSVPYALYADEAGQAQTAQQVADDSITSAQIVDKTVGTADLADDAVTTDQVADGALTGVDFADDTFDSAQIKDGSIQSVDLSKDAVESNNILDGTINAMDLNSDSVTTDKVLDGTLLSADFAVDSITSAIIKDGEVSSADLAPGAVQPANISAGYRLIPTGGIIMWIGPDCPPGFARVSELDNRFPLGTAGAAGTQGGSDPITGLSVTNTGTHSHPLNPHGHPMPHRHTAPVVGWPEIGSPAIGIPTSINTWPEGNEIVNTRGTHLPSNIWDPTPVRRAFLKTKNPDTPTTGAVNPTITNTGSHDHPISSDGTWKPSYFTVLFCQAN